MQSAGREHVPAGAGTIAIPAHEASREQLSIIANMKTSKVVFSILALAATTLAVSAADIAPIWEKSCQKCHGADGKGDTKMGKKMEVKDFTDAKYQASFTDEKATKAIKEGIKEDDKTKMKPAEGLSDDDIKALVAKVRSFKQ